MNIVIVGGGDIGFNLAKRLSIEKHNITLIERDNSKIEYAREHLDAMIVHGDGASWTVLERAGVRDADIVAALTDSDTANIVACKLAKKVSTATTIARVRNPEFLEPGFVMEPAELGVDQFIQPEQETAQAVVRLIRQASATDIVEFEGGKIELLGIRLEHGSPILHKPLKDLSQHYGDPPLRVVAIVRNHQTVIPRGDDIFVVGDRLFAVCDPEYINTFMELSGKSGKPVEDVMILGGGLVGQFIAKSLEGECNVKVIESRDDKSSEIAEDLVDSLVIHGDGTDLDLLSSEGIAEMDAFIAVTGDDETNIITSLVAQHLQVQRTVALVAKTEYLPITQTIGMDTLVSKQLMTVNAIQKFIRTQQVADVVTLPGIDAEVIEFIAQAKSKITGKPLNKVKFPVNAIIGAILREDTFIIPKGNTQVREGDKVVVFTLPNAVHAVERMFLR